MLLTKYNFLVIFKDINKIKVELQTFLLTN